MKARFLHFADCHLGNRQYNNIERGHDFGRAFIWVIDKAVAEKVDFVVLAGDLFEKRSIDAQTLQQAMRGLERLQRANIPCLAVEGNHELAYFEDRVGWMPFLAARDLLILLDAKFEYISVCYAIESKNIPFEFFNNNRADMSYRFAEVRVSFKSFHAINNLMGASFELSQNLCG